MKLCFKSFVKYAPHCLKPFTHDINDFAGLSESAGDVIIDIDGVNTITLVDTSLAEINNGDFLFA